MRVQTDVRIEQNPWPIMNGFADHYQLASISDGGREFIIAIEKGHRHGSNTRLELWCGEPGYDVTPAHWKQSEWQWLFQSGWYRRGHRCQHLLTDPLDASSSKMGRLGLPFENVSRQGARNTSKMWNRTSTTPTIVTRWDSLPNSIQFSSDGRFISYVIVNAAAILERILGDATVVEDSRTGQRFAELLLDNLAIAPGGRPARPEYSLKSGEQPRLWLWDPKTSRVRVS